MFGFLFLLGRVSLYMCLFSFRVLVDMGDFIIVSGNRVVVFMSRWGLDCGVSEVRLWVVFRRFGRFCVCIRVLVFSRGGCSGF